MTWSRFVLVIWWPVFHPDMTFTVVWAPSQLHTRKPDADYLKMRLWNSAVCFNCNMNLINLQRELGCKTQAAAANQKVTINLPSENPVLWPPCLPQRYTEANYVDINVGIRIRIRSGVHPISQHSTTLWSKRKFFSKERGKACSFARNSLLRLPLTLFITLCVIDRKI